MTSERIDIGPSLWIELADGKFPRLLQADHQPVKLTSELRGLLDRVSYLVPRFGVDSQHAQLVMERLKDAAIRSSLYAVTLHEGRREFDGLKVAEKPPIYGRQRLLDGQVFHLDLPQGDAKDEGHTNEALLMRACREVSPLHLLGIKPRDTGPSAVFLPTPDFTRGLQQAFGVAIANTVLQEDRLDRLQLLTILAHREGQRATKDLAIHFPSKVSEDERFDGLVADLDPGAWTTLLDAFSLPVDVTWLQITVLDKDLGLATKGAIRRCPAAREPLTYRASWKIGLPQGPVPARSILIHESDRTYRPCASLNLQMLAYNFTRQEQEAILQSVFIPKIRSLLDYQWTAKLRGVDRLLAAGADIRTEPVCERVNALRKKLALQGIHKAEVPGIRAKVAPDPELKPFTVRVPIDTFQIGDLVDVTRDPSLPVGNSTQRCQVVGYTEGFTIEVASEPWQTIQGGDFDGDDGCVQRVTVDLLPGKSYDRTPVAAFRTAKRKHRHGVLDDKARFEQALRVLERPIGLGDLLARRLLEEGRLDGTARLKLSEAVQSAIDSAKHATEVVDHGYRAEQRDHAIDAIRRGDLTANCIASTVYGPLVQAAIDVAQADLVPTAFDPMPIRLAYAALAARFPPEAIGEVSRLGGLYGVRFAELIQKQAGEQEIDHLADQCCVEMEKVAEGLAKQEIDLAGTTMTKEELCLTCAEVALLYRASLHLAARVVRMKTLRVVFDKASHFVRKALQAARTHWMRAAHLA